MKKIIIPAILLLIMIALGAQQKTTIVQVNSSATNPSGLTCDANNAYWASDIIQPDTENTPKTGTTALATPQNVHILKNDIHPEIWWDLVPGAEYYKIFHSEEAHPDEWILCPCIFSVPPAQDTFDPGIPRRFYRVVACNGD